MLIKLEDVNTIISNYYPIEHSWTEILEFFRKINSLPTYNPEQVLKDMMEECDNICMEQWSSEIVYDYQQIMKKYLSRINNF